jgi:hypothetical protein
MDPRLAAVALSQAGVFRTAQARVVGGYSPDEIRARLLRGSWVRLRRGVLATAGTVAAARATSDGSFVLSVAAEICVRSGLIVASHTAAARLHGLDFLEAVPDSVVLAIDIPGRAQAPSPGKAAVRQPPYHLSISASGKTYRAHRPPERSSTSAGSFRSEMLSPWRTQRFGAGL